MRNGRHGPRRSLGKRIQQLRRQRGLTQEQLAEAIDKTSKHVGQIERGEVNVGIDSLIGIARKLAVRVKDLFPDAGRPGVHVITDHDLNTLEQIATIVERISAQSRRASPGATAPAKPRRTA